ncbi:MAG: relaxase domain-containing protein [Pseudonocardiaceae bacterium]|nr:relaxase domain-containing protein [Pseudonocardiaceae bacterium]
MLSVASGHDVGYLTGAVGAGRENYYTGAVAAGEPAGQWHGAGAGVLGLRGAVDAHQMAAIYSHLLDPRDPASASPATWGEAATLGRPHKRYRSADEVYNAALGHEPHAGPERRAGLRADAERSARQAVSFLDVTFSAPKSVSVLGVAFERAAADARAAGDEQAAQAWDAHARAVEDAVMAGARASVDYLQERAGYARVGHHGGGGGMWTDAHNFVVAQFLQHDSRDRDPQLHVHQAILNRVLGADGVWRALDSRAIHAHRGAAGAVGERVMEAYLTWALGVRFETRPDGKAREVVGVSQEVRDLFSSRRRAIGAKAETLVAAFRERFSREPAPLERDRLARQATMATRRAKSHEGESLGARLDRWERETRAAVKAGLAKVAHDVLGRAQQAGPAAPWSEGDVIERALATVATGRASWSRTDLSRAISDELPGNLGVAPADVVALLDGLTDRALQHAVVTRPHEDTAGTPPSLLRHDGRSVFEQPGGTRYATRGHMAAEDALRTAAVRRGADRLAADDADRAVARFAESGVELGADQAAAVRGVLTSGADVESLTAAAGTGKSFTVGAIRETWEASGRRVFGLATSQAATKVLAEDNVTSRNITDWLATQEWLDQAQPGGPDPGGAGRWRLRRGDLVVVDEAGMTTTGDLAAISARCDAAGAKLLLVGDPRQLAAVGAGGALADVAAHGLNYELAEVRRFSNEWERPASLRLRDGDPAALDAYQRHGRLMDGGTAEQTETAAGRAWLADTLAGRESLLLVGSNEAAARTSAALRAELVALGRVAETGVDLGRQGTVAGVGDLVQARRNGWELIGVDGNTAAPINRSAYRVTGLRADGGLTVAPVLARGEAGEQLGAPMQLPARYVAEDLTLGYASTVHAAQGRTVDTAHAVIGAGTDPAGAYVAMTRGRDRNTAWAVTTAVADDAPTGQTHDTQPRTAYAVLSDVIDQAQQDRSARAEQEQADLDARSAMTHVDRLAVGVGTVTAGRTAAALDALAAEGVLSDGDRARLAADESRDSLDRLLRTAEVAGHDPATVLREAVEARDLDDARSAAQVLYARIGRNLDGQLTPRIASFAELIPAGVGDDRDRQWLAARADDADERRRELGSGVAAAEPQWAREVLGPVPEDPIARAEWEHSAGWAAAYREIAAHADVDDPLGSAPPAGLAEHHATWCTAHAALNLPDRGTEEAGLSDGRLRLRVQAFEREKVWAPRYVGDELAATHQSAQRARTDAQVWAARAAATQDAAQGEQLRADAQAAERDAAALGERAEQLEAADQARGCWYAATAVTRDAAARARAEIGARGVDLDASDQQVTAAEWLAAHRAEQTAEDPHREITDEAELVEAAHDQAAAPADTPDRAAAADTAVGSEPAVEHEQTAESQQPVAAHDDAHEPVAATVETDVPDIRDVSEPDVTEHADPAQRHRVPTVDQTTADVSRAQAALAEIEARRVADAEREAAEQQQTERRREELTRWAEQDHAANTAQAAETSDEHDGGMVLER